MREIFQYGDTVLIESETCPLLNGEWIVYDLMGPRWKNKIDFLLHKSEIDSIGFWKPHKVVLKKKKEGSMEYVSN